ncbi:MAG TPA: lysine-sensitive aspartokinase 3 [Ignavibacteria bacterium]|nr:lysine-sensitive aspartokinase 3 [Ignavibacteria bacterium]
MIVIKFGGTSVKDALSIKRVLGIIKSRLNNKPIVVSSATAGTTDKLISIGNDAMKGNFEKVVKSIFEIKNRHLTIIYSLIKSEKIKLRAEKKLFEQISELSDLTKGIYLLKELSDRTLAKISSYGELISTNILNYYLIEKGLNSVLINAVDYMVTDSSYINAEPDFTEIKKRLKKTIIPELRKNDVVITQGFIGISSDMNITTFSRGGSDYTASIIGASIKAKEIEIWTDVDGILTADPRIVKSPKILNEISFKEAAELAFFGAKVLHPSTIEPAIKNNIPVRILNSHKPEKTGTIIKGKIKNSNFAVKSITSKRNIKILNIYSTKMLFAHGFLKKIFEIFDKYKTSVDLITTSEVNVSLTLENSNNISQIMKEISEFAEVKLEENKALVCIVGNNLKFLKGIEKRIFKVIGDFKISMISQGASLINISFVVENNDLEVVIKNLHKEFFK